MFYLIGMAFDIMGGSMGIRSGRKPFPVRLSESERADLEKVIRASKSPQSHVIRAKIALMCSDEISTEDIPSSLGVCKATVCKWRKRFSLFGTGVLDDAPRSGVPRKIDDSKIAEILRIT